MLLSKPILYLNINLPSTYFILAAFVLFINFMNYILLYNVLDTEELRFQLAVQKEQLEFQRSKYQQLERLTRISAVLCMIPKSIYFTWKAALI